MGKKDRAGRGREREYITQKVKNNYQYQLMNRLNKDKRLIYMWYITTDDTLSGILKPPCPLFIHHKEFGLFKGSFLGKREVTVWAGLNWFLNGGCP